MKVYELSYPDILENEETPETVAAIGLFDGIHLGHQKVIKTAINKAKATGKESAVITFHPNPSVILSKGKRRAQYIISYEEKKRLLEEMGVDRLYTITFNKELSQLSPTEFLEHFVLRLGVIHLVAGFDFTFGYKGQGNMDNINEYINNRLSYTKVDKMSLENEKISSTKIRHLLNSGRIEEVNQLLGRTFSTSGRVYKGAQRGRTIGFPTANIHIQDDLLLPERGVYAVHVYYQNQLFYGMANLGYVPTFKDEHQLSLEVYIFDFDQEIYEEELTIEWKQKIRDEQKFSGVEQLIEQLNKDEQKVRSLFNIK